MERGFRNLGDGQLLRVVDEALDGLGDDRLRLSSDAEVMQLLRDGLRVAGRLQTWLAGVAARIETSEAAWHEHKTSATTWLAEAANVTPNEARRLIKAGQGLVRFDTVGRAAAAGRVLPSQAEAITAVLEQLPEEFDQAAVQQGQELMVGFAATHNAAELRRLTTHLVEVLAPDTMEALESDRLERELRQAQRSRFLEFHSDGQGSMRFRGSLPVVQGELFRAIIDAYAAEAKRGLDRLDPHAEYVSPAMRRADALTTMVNIHSQQALAPGNGGDRPRIVVTMSYDKLVQTAVDNGLAQINGFGIATMLGSGEPLAPSTIRQLLCDADLMPVVLGGRSEVLNVGQTQRLVTPAIRAAISLRDRGCVFPGCDTPPERCHAHHRIPWRDGGETSYDNLVLLCGHHHAIVEPPRPGSGQGVDDRWQLRFREDGIPQVIPPTRVDATRRPRVHARFHTRTAGVIRQ